MNLALQLHDFRRPVIRFQLTGGAGPGHGREPVASVKYRGRLGIEPFGQFRLENVMAGRILRRGRQEDDVPAADNGTAHGRIHGCTLESGVGNGPHPIGNADGTCILELCKDAAPIAGCGAAQPHDQNQPRHTLSMSVHPRIHPAVHMPMPNR